MALRKKAIKKMKKLFRNVETTKKYNGYFYSVEDTLTITILGFMCGLQNVSQIHEWAKSEQGRGFLLTYAGISNIPSYYWMLCLLKLVNLTFSFFSTRNSQIPKFSLENTKNLKI